MKHILFSLALILLFLNSKAQWVQTNGLYGGTVNRIIKTGNNLVCATQSGDAYISSDTGRTWHFTHDQISYLTKAGKYLYGGDYISADNGLTWTMHGPIYDDVFEVGDSIFITGPYWYGQTMCSSDSGYSFHQSSINLPGWNILRQSNNKIYAATPNGIYVTTDHFLSWNNVDSGAVGGQISELLVQDSAIMAVTPAGLHCSVNSGSTWTLGFPGIVNHLSVFGSRVFINDQAGYLHFSDNYGASWDTCFYSISLTSIVNMGGILFTSNEAGIYKSTNAGLSWVKSDSLINNRKVFNMRACGPYLFASGWREGLYRSADNGYNWQKIDLPFHETFDVWSHVNKIYVDGNALCLAIWGHGILITTDYGNTWNHYLEGKALMSLAKKGNLICASDIWGYCYSSTDGGAHWQTSNNNVPAYGFNCMEIGSNFIYAGYDGIHRSADNGLTWTTVNQNQGAPTSLQWSNGKLYASNTWGDLRYSNDDGLTWTKIFTGNNSAGYDFSVRNNHIWLVNENHGLFYSDDNGVNFDTIVTNLPHKFYSLCVTDTSLVLGTNHSIFHSPAAFAMGIKQTVFTDSYSLFPNPTTGTINFDFAAPVTGKIVLYDGVGKVVFSQPIINADKQSLNIGVQAAGIYLLKIYTANGVESKKIILTR